MSTSFHPASKAKGTYQTNAIICGVNSTIEKIEKGQNENCRVFSVNEQKCVVALPVEYCNTYVLNIKNGVAKY